MTRAIESETWTRGLRIGSEAIVLALACLSPWAIGAVDSWAGFGLASGVTLLALFHLILEWNRGWCRRIFCLPSLAIAGLGLLALAQATPIPNHTIRSIDRSIPKTRAELAPSESYRVAGDPRPEVGAPAETLSLDPDSSMQVAVQLAGAWILFQASMGLGGFVTLRRFGIALTANTALLSLFSIAQSLAWQGKIYGLRTAPSTTGWFTGGPFVSHNHLAAYLNLGVGFSVAFLILASQRRPALPASRGPAAWGSKGVIHTPTNYAYLTPAYAVGMILVGMLFSHSRGGFLAMVVSGVLAAVILRPKNFYLKGLGSVLVLVPLILLVVGSTSPFLRLASILDLTESGYTVRFALWRHVFPVWLQHPFLGTGLGSFAVAAAPYADFRMDDLRFFSHAENEYLQMLVEAGVVGLALTLLAIGGIGRLAARAYKATTTVGERGMVLAGIASCIALVFQSLSDFPMHIPGITVPAVILVGYLCRIGLDGRSDAAAPASWLNRALSNLASFGMIALSVPVLGYEWTMARAEILVVQAGMPFPKTEMPSGGLEVLPKDVLETRQAALQAALRLRPNWWEGHYRLGMNYLGFFELTASEWLKEVADEAVANDPSLRPRERLVRKADTKPTPTPPTPLRVASSSKADPVWIHFLAHSTPPEKLTADGGLLTQEPVRDFLVPAAHEFLEARRCCPSLAAPHLRLASLDYLIEHGEPTAKHVERTLRLAGSNSPILDLAAQLALQVGDRDLAARCWHQSLEVRTDRDGWIKVADAAGGFLTPERILNEVIPSNNAGMLMRFADRLYAEPEAQAAREMFLKAALKRVPLETELTSNERLWLTSQIQARLDDRKDARPGMEAAISNEPMRSEWRHELIAWLLLWGDPEEAHHQALTGTALDPKNEGLQRVMKLAVEAKVVGPQGGADPRGQPETFGNASRPAPTK